MIVIYFGWCLFFMNVAAQKNEKPEKFLQIMSFIAVGFFFLWMAYLELKKNFCIQ